MRDNPEMEKTTLSQSVSNAFTILEYLSDQQGGVPIRRLSEQLGIARSTTHRLLLALESKGFVCKDSQTGNYKLGTKILLLVSKLQEKMGIREEALPIMREARTQCGETITLLVIEGAERVCIESLEGLQPLRGVISVGARLPLHCGASGKLLLASLTEKEIDGIIGQQGLLRFTEKTITDLVKMKKELRMIRRQQYAVSHGERYAGVSSLATPIRDATGKVIAAFTISGPNIRFNRTHLPLLLDLAKKSAETISRRLGFDSFGKPFARREEAKERR